MANTIKIAGDIRDEFGKGAARRMRVAKLIPATLYAGGDQPTFVKLPMKETTLALRHTNALFSISFFFFFFFSLGAPPVFSPFFFSGGVSCV